LELKPQIVKQAEPEITIEEESDTIRVIDTDAQDVQTVESLPTDGHRRKKKNKTKTKKITERPVDIDQT
jgi:hypothetical protein